MDSTLASIQPSSQSNSVPSAHHRKIELQSYADLTYLQQNLARSARAKLDLHFPPLPSSSRPAAPATIISLDGPTQQSQQSSIHNSDNATSQNNPDTNSSNDNEDIEDPLRARVRHLIDSFLHETNQAASHSISVNGIDATSIIPSSRTPNCSNPEPTPHDASTLTDDNSIPTVQEIEGIHYTYEPFDARLQKKLASLHGELESLTAQVSKLRREAPKQSAAIYSQTLNAEMQHDDEEWETEQKRLLEEQYSQDLNMSDLKQRKGWNEDVRTTYERGVNQLAVLSGVVASSAGGSASENNSVSLTETVGRAQRARNVAMEFE